MADNVGYTPGSGAIVAADEIDGVLFQRVKPTIGDDGVVVDVSTANPMPVVSDRTNQLLSTLQRLTKILESNQVVDSAQRQRITIDAIAAGVSLPGVSTVTTVTTVTAVSTVAAQTSMAGMDREMYINIAKQTYANSIRNRLNIV